MLLHSWSRPAGDFTYCFVGRHRQVIQFVRSGCSGQRTSASCALWSPPYNEDVSTEPAASEIRESSFEHRLSFAEPWFDLWAAAPNPFLRSLFPVIRQMGVELADVSFNGNATNLSEVSLNILVRKIGREHQDWV